MLFGLQLPGDQLPGLSFPKLDLPDEDKESDKESMGTDPHQGKGNKSSLLLTTDPFITPPKVVSKLPRSLFQAVAAKRLEFPLPSDTTALPPWNTLPHHHSLVEVEGMEIASTPQCQIKYYVTKEERNNLSDWRQRGFY